MSSSRSTGMRLYHSLLLAIDMMACTFRNPSSKVICMSCAVTWGDLMRNDLAKKSSDEHWPEDPLETLPTRDEPTRSLSSTCRSKAVSPRHVYVQFPSLDALHALCGQSQCIALDCATPAFTLPAKKMPLHRSHTCIEMKRWQEEGFHQGIRFWTEWHRIYSAVVWSVLVWALYDQMVTRRSVFDVGLVLVTPF